MRSPAKGVRCFLVLCLISARVASAQAERASSKGAHPVTREASDRPQKAIQSRPLTLGEGLAILGAALDSRHYADSASDCSHFVHELYGRAGFPYEYASSSDLYAGADFGEWQTRNRVTWQSGGDMRGL